MEADLFFAALDPLRVVLVAVAAFAGSLAAGLSGLGGGMLLAIVIAPIVGIDVLVPVMTITMLLNHVARVGAFYRDVDWKVAGRVTLTALPATVIGAWVYAALPPNVIAIVIGVLALLFVPARRLTGDAAWRVGTAGMLGIGGIFGFLSGTAIGAGMLLVPVLLGTGLAGPVLVGTDAVIGIAVLIVKTITFGTLAVLTTDIVTVGVVVGLFTMPGVYVARWILRKSSVRMHTLIVEIMIVGGGISFVWRGIHAS